MAYGNFSAASDAFRARVCRRTARILKDKFPQTELFRVEDKFGSWPEVMKTHFTSGGELDKLLAAGRN